MPGARRSSKNGGGGGPRKTEDEKLLNGPQRDGEGISQSEIDALFG